MVEYDPYEYLKQLVAQNLVIVLKDQKLTDQILSFPEHGMGYVFVDFTLKDGSTVERVPVSNCEVVCFEDGKRKFTEDEIASVARSQT